MTLKVGDKSPDFKGVTAEGPISLKALKGSNVVLYFYPKDDTPGCTKEACGFRDTLPKFTKMNAKIFGVSKDDLTSHAKFVEKYELPFALITDEDGSICDSFGTWGERTLYGRKFMGIERATFLIDKDGVLQQIWRNVKVDGHVEDVLENVKKLK